MSSIHLPKVVSQRGKTSLDIERENFEKRQTVALTKAINNQETPVKEKHARSAILGTFQDQGGNMFWSIASKMPVQANPIVAWKFLQVIHKLMRDGHANVVPDSVKYANQIRDLGKLWGHLKEGYGKLISGYCRLIIQKFKFHRKFPGIPGNLMMTDEQYYKICGADVNNYFEFSIDMLDYMDEILSLQHSVFGSLDMSRANSMTSSGQCRLAPLILCILDSCQLYDYLVKSLFHLHSSLPPDTLSGHRDRFLQCYKKLKEFYFKCSNLQYFKHLVQVPALPENPPNFLIASDFTKHIKPAAVVKEVEPEPDADTDSVDNLIDMSIPEQVPEVASRPPEPDERDFLIERLRREIQQLRDELNRLRVEDQRIISGLNDEISKLEKILSELRLSANKSLKENEGLKKDIEQLKADALAASKLPEAEKHAKANQEKFQKMKEIYSKLREEHVSLLRNHDSLTKQLAAEKKTAEEKDQILKENQLELNRMVDEKKMVQDNLQKSANDISQQLAEVSSFNSKLEKQKEDLEARIRVLEEAKSQLESDLDARSSELHTVSQELQETKEQAQEKEQELTESNDTLKMQLEQVRTEKDNIEARLGERLTEAQSKLAETEADRDRLQAELDKQVTTLTSRCEQLETQKKELEESSKAAMDRLRRQIISRSVQEASVMIQDALEQGDNPTHASSTCTAEYLISRAAPVLSRLSCLESSAAAYRLDTADLDALVSSITEFAHHLSDCVVHGFATSHAAQIEPGEELSNACRHSGQLGIALLQAVDSEGHVEGAAKVARDSLEHLIKLAEELVPKMEDVKAEEIGDMLENEMQGMTAAIEAAAAKIQDMLHKTREDKTGVNLEVNENILGSCTELMKAIKVLVEKSRDLQKEIVSCGRGTASATDFYKKNHRWTEGLLSAAKAVGWGATTLLDTADRVVSGKGKFEEIMACAHEIAASTAQLVVSSKVKADRDSKLLAQLSSASKGVNQATGNVVASAKAAAEIVEDQNLMDFSSMSLHQIKKTEMQCQIRVMELESNLEKERKKLGELRKQHYSLAGEAEGWEVDQKR
ncbi:huntingtin-interacting protein 1-like isoform X2 [Physella acuta]|uniref:huntingtin-interacting protein 1-like isoform X2 n=1 Tax=Physella acuta TaxID=109671 RepID=UPI0027DCC1CE|nr:huntingtin-interacting protein 1-like isoform X2 [Physella acuta]